MDEGRRVAKRHDMPFARYAPRFFQLARERALGDVEVRLSKAQRKTEVLPPIFLFALSGDVQRFFHFACPHVIFQYEYEQ